MTSIGSVATNRTMKNILEKYTKPQITKAQIARACGVNRNAPGRWRRGVPKKYLSIVAGLLNVPREELRPDFRKGNEHE